MPFPILVLVIVQFLSFSACADDPIVIDAVVASVNGKPITLQELNTRLGGKELTLKQAAADPQAREVLDNFILERLIEEDAAVRHINVSDDEITRYVEELAKQNGLSVSDFDAALKKEGKSLNELKTNARFEILRSRLANQHLQSSVSISDDEVNKYIENNTTLGNKGTTVKLSQILLRVDVRSEEDALTLALNIREKIDDGDSFSELAAKYSESPEGKEGGSLGIVAQEDLSPQIFDAVFALSQGEVSMPVKTPAGVHLFRLEERFVQADESSQAIREDVRKKLKAQKVQEQMYTYFSSELPKLYSVERKL